MPAVQVWMGHSDVQTTMRFVHHRDRGGEARLLAEAFGIDSPPAGDPRDLDAHDEGRLGTLRRFGMKRPQASPAVAAELRRSSCPGYQFRTFQRRYGPLPAQEVRTVCLAVEGFLVGCDEAVRRPSNGSLDPVREDA